MDLGLKFSPSLSAESLLIYRIYLFSAYSVAKVLKFLFLCFQKNLLLVQYSEISETKPLLSQCFEAIISLLDGSRWELCSQNSLSSWDFSDDLKILEQNPRATKLYKIHHHLLQKPIVLPWPCLKINTT